MEGGKDFGETKDQVCFSLSHNVVPSSIYVNSCR